MASKQKNLFLYLAVVCFIGIILIFVFDGYMGLYDTLSVTAGEQIQTVSPDQWSDSNRQNYPVELWPLFSDNFTFSYVIDNRSFSPYQTDINVSVWQNKVKVTDILTTTVNAGAFQKDTITEIICPWTTLGGTVNADNQFTLEINHGHIIRRVIIHYGLNNPKILVPLNTTQ